MPPSISSWGVVLNIRPKSQPPFLGSFSCTKTILRPGWPYGHAVTCAQRGARGRLVDETSTDTCGLSAQLFPRACHTRLSVALSCLTRLPCPTVRRSTIDWLSCPTVRRSVRASAASAHILDARHAVTRAQRGARGRLVYETVRLPLARVGSAHSCLPAPLAQLSCPTVRRSVGASAAGVHILR